MNPVQLYTSGVCCMQN